MSQNSIALLWKILDATTEGQPSDVTQNDIAVLGDILENLENADTLTDTLDAGGNDIQDVGSLNVDDAVVDESLTFNSDTVAIGIGATSAAQSVAIGEDATADSGNTVSVGRDADASFNSVSVGRQATTQNDGVAVGRGAVVTVNSAMALGENTQVGVSGVTRIGYEQVVLPALRDTIPDADLNNSELTVELDESNSAFRLRGKDSGGVVREATIAW